MKNVLVVLFLLLTSTLLYSQTDKNYFSLLPGRHAAVGELDYYGGISNLFNGHYDAGSSFKMSYSRYFTEHLALQASVLQISSLYSEIYWRYWCDDWYWTVWSYHTSFYILEVGPELNTGIGKRGQLYVQMNLGYLLNDSRYYTNYGSCFKIDNFQKCNATLGLALGARVFFSKIVALVIEYEYNTIKNWTADHLNSGHVGVSIRF